VFDPETGEINLRATILACKAYDAATPAERRAWHRVTCRNSRDLIDTVLAGHLVEAIQQGLE
jgi:hypothetical protein